jgi:hypothetical protein
VDWIQLAQKRVKWMIFHELLHKQRGISGIRVGLPSHRRVCADTDLSISVIMRFDYMSYEDVILKCDGWMKRDSMHVPLLCPRILCA